MTTNNYSFLIALGVAALLCICSTPVQAQSGADAFGDCAGCHSVEKGMDSVGPSLYGIVGRRVSTEEGFSYSSAMKKQKFVWTENLLNRFIANPQAMIPGTTMTYSGMPDARQRAAIIAP